MSYYILTREQAQSLGLFEYEKNKFFNALVCEQKDGTYLIGMEIVEQLKNDSRVKNIDWKSLEVTENRNLKTSDSIPKKSQ